MANSNLFGGLFSAMGIDDSELLSNEELHSHSTPIPVVESKEKTKKGGVPKYDAPKDLDVSKATQKVTTKKINKTYHIDLEPSELEAFKFQNLLKFISMGDKPIGILDCTESKERYILKTDYIQQIIVNTYSSIPEFKAFIHTTLKDNTAKTILAEPLRFKFGVFAQYDNDNKISGYTKDLRIVDSIYTYQNVLIYNRNFDKNIQILPSQNKKDSKVNQYHKDNWVNATEDTRILPISLIGSSVIKFTLEGVNVSGRLDVGLDGIVTFRYINTEELEKLVKRQFSGKVGRLVIGVLDGVSIISTEHYQNYCVFSVKAIVPILCNHSLVRKGLDKLIHSLNYNKEYINAILHAISKRDKELKDSLSKTFQTAKTEKQRRKRKNKRASAATEKRKQLIKYIDSNLKT